MRALNARQPVAFREPSLSAAGDRFVLDFQEPPSGVDTVLAPVLRSAAETLGGKDSVRLKSCPGHGCGWLFYDETKNSNRV